MSEERGRNGYENVGERVGEMTVLEIKRMLVLLASTFPVEKETLLDEKSGISVGGKRRWRKSRRDIYVGEEKRGSCRKKKLTKKNPLTDKEDEEEENSESNVGEKKTEEVERRRRSPGRRS